MILIKITKKLPKRIQRRLELSGFFYPLERKVERKWGKIFSSETKDIFDYFEELATSKNYIQERVDPNKIIWKEKNGSIECMFCFIEDLTKLQSVRKMFSRISKFNPIFTYAIVHQKKDGEGVYDIFRFSKFSYLEHCNRVKSARTNK